MKLLDYTGKLNRHADYLYAVKLLETKCEYIEYVLVDEDDTELIEQFRDSIISVKTQNKWWGTKSASSSKVYTISASKELFRYLRKFETFCKCGTSDFGKNAAETDFGINDIAFFDKNELPLLFTTTHEGYITVRSDLFA